MSRRRKHLAGDQLGSSVRSNAAAPEIEIVITDDPGEERTSGLPEVQDPGQEIETREAQTERTADPEPENEIDPLEAMRAQYAARETEVSELRERLAEEARRAASYKRESEEHQSGYRAATETALDNAIALSKTNFQQAQDALTLAMAQNDSATVAKAVAAMTEHQTQLQQLQTAKQNLDGQRLAPRTEDPFEQQIAQLPEKSRDWARRHRDDLRDPERQEDVKAAHRLAIRRGHEPESDGYFKFIDDQMGYAVDNSSSRAGAVPPPQNRGQTAKPQTAAAPPARNTFGVPNAGKIRMSMTKAERETALQMFSNLPEAEALALYAEGIKTVNSGTTNLQWSRDKYRGGPGV